MKLLGNEKGISVILVVLVMMILSILGSVLISLVTTESLTSAGHLEAARAIYVAEAGAEWYLRSTNPIPAEGTSTDLTPTTLTDSSASWIDNEFVGNVLIPDISAPLNRYTIASNTATTITCTGATMTTDGATVGDNYFVSPYMNVGGGSSNFYYVRNGAVVTSVGEVGNAKKVVQLTIINFGLDVVYGTDGKTIEVSLGDGSTFGTPISYPADRTIYTLALGDMDGDNDLDVVYGTDSKINQQLEIRLNDGTSTLGAATLYSAGRNIYALALGDMDGDNDLDVVYGTDSKGNRLEVRFNDGTGALGGATTYATNSAVYALALGDMDGDNVLDVVYGTDNKTNQLEVRFNIGGGVFGGATTYTANDNINAIALGDMNGDNDLDVVYGTDNKTNQLEVRLNTGGGALGGATTYSANSTINTIVLGDMDGDTDLDAVYGTDNTINQLEVRLNAGGTLGAATTYAANDVINSVALDDINADGHLDVAYGTEHVSDSLETRFNTGTGGNLDPATTYIIGNEINAVALGEMN